MSQKSAISAAWCPHRNVECKLDASLAAQGSAGEGQTFSRTMALRRLHLKNSVLGELLYAVNIYKVRCAAIICYCFVSCLPPGW